eukprot:scaffold35403_cov16-Tisochrysis_lutea.AAC.3
MCARLFQLREGCLVRPTIPAHFQVGCIPEEPGFKAGPSGDETEGQWCPCSITWSPSHTDQPLELDLEEEGAAYSIVEGLKRSRILAFGNSSTILSLLKFAKSCKDGIPVFFEHVWLKPLLIHVTSCHCLPLIRI